MRRFRQLVRRHQQSVYAFALHYLGDADDAADVTQEVLIRMWENHDRLDEARLGAWLMRVTRNMCIDVYRRKKQQRATVDVDTDGAAFRFADSDDPDPAQRVESLDLRSGILAALRRVTEPQRSILMLREIHELTYEEISGALDLPLNTVKVYLHRGRHALRDILQEEHLYERDGS